ncbi:hypothetical protein [Longimicrobium sp.]|uniref:hypothetical protein n=1 Tax=Longimicrobium sp. TaxID=2029185 RepID=UPI002E371646|nr:hypothetical protein [Longimicrobium sp.]HEX6041772.1 hypothetical protein [Longimicrobium sp.]
MRKLKLSLDSLQVESFAATGSEPVRGTVPGHEWTEYADESCFGTCDGGCTRDGSCVNPCGTGYASCYGTCYASCGGTCDATCGCPPNTGYTYCDCQTWETCPGASICA